MAVGLATTCPSQQECTRASRHQAAHAQTTLAHACQHTALPHCAYQQVTDLNLSKILEDTTHSTSMAAMNPVGWARLKGNTNGLAGWQLACWAVPAASSSLLPLARALV